MPQKGTIGGQSVFNKRVLSLNRSILGTLSPSHIETYRSRAPARAPEVSKDGDPKIIGVIGVHGGDRDTLHAQGGVDSPLMPGVIFVLPENQLGLPKVKKRLFSAEWPFLGNSGQALAYSLQGLKIGVHRDMVGISIAEELYSVCLLNFREEQNICTG